VQVVPEEAEDSIAGELVVGVSLAVFAHLCAALVVGPAVEFDDEAVVDAVRLVTGGPVVQ
jgi:hypothetical protein